MTVDERDRLRLFDDAKALLPEGSAVTLMAMLADRATRDEVATREDLAALRAELREEMGELRAELRGEIAALRVEVSEQLRAMTVTLCTVMCTVLVAGMGIAAGVAAGVSQIS